MGHRKVRLGRVTDTDIRLFRLFKVIVDARGLAAAEVELGISRSTISTHLSDLETRLGMRLCERGRGGFALTDAGSAVYSAICSLMDSLDHFTSEINTLNVDLTGQLTVALSDNHIWNSSLKLVESISNFLQVAPSVKLNLVILSPSEIEIKLIDGEVDIGLSPIIRKLPTLDYKKSFTETSYVYCGKSHKLFHVDDDLFSIDDVIDADLIYSDYVSHELTPRPIDRSYVVSNYLEAAAMLVLSGRYISFLPDYYADYWVSRGEMRQLKPTALFSKSHSGVITRKGRTETPTQAAFIKSLAF